MTTELVRFRSSRWIVFSSALLALCVIAAACASPDADPVVAVADADPVAVAENVADLSDGDGPQYGDSLEDWSDATEPAREPANVIQPGFRGVEWEDLIPPGSSGAEIVARFEDRLAALEPGSPETDALYEEMRAEYDSSAVNPTLNGEDIQLAGFVAPLNFDGDVITEFLLVPYFGACIHVPPPPPNQTVLVTLNEGESLTLEESWGAVWVTGTLIANTTDTDLATAGYSVSGAQFGVYGNQ